MAKGVQANWIHRGAPRPANPVRRHPAKSVWMVVRMIMILDVDVTAERRHYNTHRPLKGKRLTTFCASLRSGGRRLAVRTAMEHPIGTLPRTPFPASRDFPSRGNERYGEKNRASYTSCTIPVCPPLVAGATTLPGGKHVTGFAGRLQLPYESSSFATPASGGTMDV